MKASLLLKIVPALNSPVRVTSTLPEAGMTTLTDGPPGSVA